MSIELYWDNDDQSVLLCEFEGQWTWDEMFATLNTVRKITAKAEHEIAAIIDLRHGVHLPGGTLFTADNLDKAKQIVRMGDEGTGPLYIVGANAAVRTIYATLAPMNRRATANIHFVDSLRRARALLSKHYEPQTAALQGREL